MKKNDEIILEITDIGVGGEGIGHFDKMAYFVNGAIPGDVVRAGITRQKKNYGYARVIEIVKPSPDRVEPACEMAKKCGGCQLMQMDYEAQLQWKLKTVKEKLIRIGGLSPEMVEEITEPVVGMEKPRSFRNKAQYPVGCENGRIVMGFYAHHSHRIVGSESCAIGRSINEKIKAVITDCPKVIPYDESTGKGLLRHVMIRGSYHYEDVMVVLVVNAKKMTPKLREMTEALLPELKAISHEDAKDEVALDHPGISRVTTVVINYNPNPGNVIMSESCQSIYGDGYIRDRIGEVEYRISALSFFQVNPRQTKKLYEKAREYAALTGTEIVWDLYCGIGTIALFMASKAKEVYGVEVVRDAISDAKINAGLNHMENAHFITGDAKDVTLENGDDPLALPAPDVIVVDPPRKGCDERLINTILQAAPKRIVYVSCDPGTLARDMALLIQGGYKPMKITPVDQFGHSVHVECVVLMSKVKE